MLSQSIAYVATIKGVMLKLSGSLQIDMVRGSKISTLTNQSWKHLD
jgi:hypothetical protein